jgi:V/A-type H+/Na+-transporting ATPase subunit K
MSESVVLALIGVGIAVSLGAIGSALGVGKIAKIGGSLLSKDPERFPQILALAALPSTQSLYGLLFGFIVLIKTGLISGKALEFDRNTGLALMLAALPVGIATLFSGIAQGSAAEGGLKILAQKPENFTQAIVLVSLIESFAIFGLVISLLIVFVGIQIPA